VVSVPERPSAQHAQIILVVDDEDIVRHLLTRALSEAGYEVVQAFRDFYIKLSVVPQLNIKHRATGPRMLVTRGTE
jgi:ActR/RegA family two-component response regulator